ncbi:uncharacterized protein LOC117654276 [Thrips palmi]|uniref:Uncharacterized protein LOC117654276 n=1 Tax=Thrips palmi TaxID=161013 RepID=A0A6P9AM54_THRPL|nr:uncharacterized protein LOC117654276 [Thrips palmi]XP_034256654.1 uncharacterized protein LOC117654276 [Thrips palmi]XP_034256655.1 uncharacterized protein LOC117654276 [Thrips palmi]XP_034256656.1 uncharacterized protein LOC117654276 [Thrips palmi]XP_034256657.1 uncharacterized protein LOC117654276 [Thrips palmi]XP_034256658.1 uncharacterized protein LOC117654276 [Thrips palmi]XP_034256659.1 uncharacterized protein LOC117654276 [Thrips palmi]XP_034256660.1 uncharacterized protein LOC1176
MECGHPTSASVSAMDEPSTLLALPDDALLAVLAFLQPRQLLKCRPVCRRLRDLCLHPQLWRTVRLDNDFEGPLCAALRLAPCLRTLIVVSPFSANLTAAVYSTTCVVSELALVLEDESGQAFAVAALHVISALGGLRKLDLDIMYAIASFETDPILRVAFSLKDIRLLTFNSVELSSLPQTVSWPEGRPSVTCLSYQARVDDVDPFMGLVLRTHAATLEEVAISRVLGELPVALLVNMPRLWSLRCSSQDCVSQLQGLPNLKSLSVEHDGAWSPGLLDYLRQAPRLQSVTFEGLKAHIDIVAPLRALAESPCANALQSLSLPCKLEMFELVASTLPQFPSLQTLELLIEDAGPFDSFLRAVSSSTAPCLTELRLAPGGCPHAFLHGPALLDVLARNPRLHFRILSAVWPYCACQWCAWGCHVELRGAALGRAFAGHARTTDCPKDCFKWRPCHCNA